MVFVKEESEENTSEPETWRIKHEEPETWRIKHEEPETWRIKHEEPETQIIKHEEPETWRIKREEPETWRIKQEEPEPCRIKQKEQGGLCFYSSFIFNDCLTCPGICPFYKFLKNILMTKVWLHRNQHKLCYNDA